MGDDESRRQEAREDEAISRAIRENRMGPCIECGDLTSEIQYHDDEGYPVGWLCKRCAKAQDEAGD